MSNNDNNSSAAADRFEVTTHGGVTRASIPSSLTIGAGPAVSLPGAGASSDGVHRGVIRHDGLTGETTQHGVTQASSGGLIDKSSILGTYRSAFGTPTSDHRSDGTVAVDPSNPDGMRTSIANALKLGLIHKGPSGTYVDAWDGTPTGAQVEEKVLGPKVDETITQDLFAPADQKAFDDRIAPLHQAIYDSTIASGSVHVADGGLDADSIINVMGDRLAREAGGTRAEHTETARMAFNLFDQQVSAAVAAAGIPKSAQSAMYDWVRATPSGKSDLRAALVQLTAARSTAGFVSMAQQFLAKASPSADRMKAEGFKVRGSGSTAEYEDEDGSWRPVSGMRFQASK